MTSIPRYHEDSLKNDTDIEEIRARLFNGTLPIKEAMPQVGKTEHVCAFCMLVIEIGYENLTPDDIAKINVHMKIAHGLRRYEIQA